MTRSLSPPFLLPFSSLSIPFQFPMKKERKKRKMRRGKAQLCLVATHIDRLVRTPNSYVETKAKVKAFDTTRH